MDTQHFPMVLLAYDGTGDFGPQTPDTETAGWQEAINHCVEHKKDLYVKGGWGGQTAIYNVNSTIYIPATQDFRIDGGIYVLNWTGTPDKDMLVVDSGMDCHYTFGILVYGGMKAALRVKPENPVPIDKAVVFIDSDIKTSSVAEPHPFQPGERKGSAGVIFDTSNGPILHSDFYFTAILNFATCIETSDSGGEFAYNSLECIHLHTNADKSTLLRLGKKSFQNVLKFRIGVDQKATEVKGLKVFGAYNNLEVITRGGFPKGNDIIFEESAEGNQVNIIQRKSPFKPLDIITDRALKPTNQITWTGGTVIPKKFRATKGTFVYIQRLYPATVRLIDGDISEVTLIRGNVSINYGTSPVYDILMSVGDKLEIKSTVPPTLVIISR